MPQGYEEMFIYGNPLKATGLEDGLRWNYSATPLIEYRCVYTYRSGTKSKSLKQDGYNSNVTSGDLGQQMRQRKAYLEQAMRDNLFPSTGRVDRFSTRDSGHPFGVYRIKSHNPYAKLRFYRNARTNCELVGAPDFGVIWPDSSSPFGNAWVDGNPMDRVLYTTWPSNLQVQTAAFSNRRILTRTSKDILGSGLIASSNPWKPKADLAVTIVELLTGDVPSLFKNLEKYMLDLKSLRQTAGSDWLNVQFGWVPLMSDIRNAIDTLYKLHLLLYQSREKRRGRSGDIGDWSRFSTDIPPGRSVVPRSPLKPNLASTPFLKNVQGSIVRYPVPFTDQGSWTRATRVKIDYTFSARYHQGAVPNSTALGYIDRAVELLGLKLTPDKLWELTPWTWLLDWGSNLGSVAENLSQLDWSNVLLDYSYLTIWSKSDMSVSVALKSQKWMSGSDSIESDTTFISQNYSAVEKVREQASPVGFGVSWDGLSPFQLSILAALGMSRGR